MCPPQVFISKSVDMEKHNPTTLYTCYSVEFPNASPDKKVHKPHCDQLSSSRCSVNTDPLLQRSCSVLDLIVSINKYPPQLNGSTKAFCQDWAK